MVFTSVFSPIFSPLLNKLQTARPSWHYHELKDNFAEKLRTHFIAKHQIVMIGAIALPVRILAPFLLSKHDEPPIVVISPDGLYVIPILGGHHGGNDLACEIADILGSTSVLTNSSPDPLAAIPQDWQIKNCTKLDQIRKKITQHNVALLADCFFARIPQIKNQQTAKYELDIIITDKASPQEIATVIHPPTLTLGMGCIRHAETSTIIEFVERTLIERHIAKESIAAITTIERKRHEPALQALAKKWNIPIRVFDAETLHHTHQRYGLSSNDTVYQAVGVHSVAEACALSMASSMHATDAHLVLPKVIHPQATLAVASACRPLKFDEIAQRGSAVGMLHIIGIGPGDKDFLTIDSIKALRCCDAIVGYSLYTDLIASYIADKEIHSFSLGEELLRVEKAITLAESGRMVGLIGSGDASIYALASLAFEELALREEKIAVAVHPGISAMVMASSRMGAILGHDFCAISLSDLLTKRESILHRVQHAAQGDFVIAFYNPQSASRLSLLPQSIHILQQHRPPKTPVLIARNLTRENENLTLVALEDFSSKNIDMLSIVIVGSKESKSIAHIPLMKHAAYTPRGYN